MTRVILFSCTNVVPLPFRKENELSTKVPPPLWAIFRDPYTRAIDGSYQSIRCTEEIIQLYSFYSVERT